MTEKPAWRYRCSICHELVEPDKVAAHTDEERAKPGWPGHMMWDRVDEGPDDE